MEDYFKKAKIDNPLNIKRLGGDIPTTKSSSKNVLILLASFIIIALTFSRVWQTAIYYLKSPVITGIVLFIIYGLIIAKIFSISIFEERKQREAYKDLLQNKMSDLSVIWEIQDIKEEEIMGTKVAYIDYINGSRTMLLRCVPGSILNLDEDMPKYHYSSIERVLKYIGELGYSYDINIIEESITDEEALRYYYDKLKDYDDEDFISIFTEQLDVINHVSQMRSAIHVLYIEVTGIGKYKHNMVKNIITLPEVLGKDNIFKDIEIVNSKSKIDFWIANIHSVSMFDREELIMNKYRNSFDLGLTSVLASFDNDGNVIERFNKDFDIKKLVRKKSIPLTDTPEEEEQVLQTLDIPVKEKIENKVKLVQVNVDKIRVEDLKDTQNKKLIELLYSKDKVKLG